jgi:hypothetical protein
VDLGPLPDGYVPRPDLGHIDGGGACVPSVEICGDYIDENCDGRETPCGDPDGDGYDSCSVTDTDLTLCDCDGLRPDVYPPRGGLPGAPELCDSRDNDCDGYVDEASACCAGCASLGAERTIRADECTPDGVCDCTTEPGIGACPAGQTCCTGGCVDLQTDFANCGACNSGCTTQSDNCSAGACHCGTGPACSLDTACTGGPC